MRIVLRYNPLSGKGRAAAIADAAESRLRSAGHEVRRVEFSRDDPGALGRALDWDGLSAGAVAIIGGDGTLHHALPDLLSRAVPVYHVPLGTENLFARQFDMDRDLDRLAAAASAGRTEAVDVGVCNGVPFALMCSMGPDANIIHRLVRTRRGRISHFSYVAPLLAELRRPGFPRFTVDLDGQRILEGRRGLLVVANSRQYALRIDPAARASMTDGLLDVIFLPCATSARFVRWAVSARLRRHLTDPDAVYATGREVIVLANGGDADGVCYQIDGEAGPRQENEGGGIGPVRRLHCVVHPRALRVLMPP